MSLIRRRSLPMHAAFQRLPREAQALYAREDAVSEVLMRSGPAPLDVLGEILRPGSSEAAILSALRGARLDELRGLQHHLNVPYTPNQLFDTLLLWRRAEEGARTDLRAARFKSGLAFDLLARHLQSLGIRADDMRALRENPGWDSLRAILPPT